MRWPAPWLALALAGMVACSSTPPRQEAAPVDIAAMQESAQASYAAGRWAEAAQLYTALLRHVPQDPDLWFRLANACARSEQPDRAVAAYREALLRDPGYSKAWFNMGIVQLRQAANSFLKMGAYVSTDDVMREQATAAYNAILDILNQGGGDETAGAAPAAAAPVGDLPVSGAGHTPGPGPAHEGSSDAETFPAD